MIADKYFKVVMCW